MERKQRRKTWRSEGDIKRQLGERRVEVEERKAVYVSVRVRERRIQSCSLQAPHFCQQWHLYLLNALLMPHHICCSKLLLGPVSDDEEKVKVMRAGVPWFCPESFLMEDRKRKISGTSLLRVCYSTHPFSFFPPLTFSSLKTVFLCLYCIDLFPLSIYTPFMFFAPSQPKLRVR